MGGLRVILEPDVRHILSFWADHNPDSIFNQALDSAYTRKSKEQENFVDLFFEEYKKLDSNGNIVGLFDAYGLKEKVHENCTEKEMLAILKNEIASERNETMKCLSTRIDSYGLPSSFRWLGKEERMLVEIPGVKEPYRAIKIIESNADLEFWETYKLTDIYDPLLEADKRLAVLHNTDSLPETNEMVRFLLKKIEEDELPNDELQALLKSMKDEPDANASEYTAKHPLLSLLMINANAFPGSPAPEPGAIIGYALENDIDRILAYLVVPEIKTLFSPSVVFKFGAKPISDSEDLYALYALKKTGKQGYALNGEVVTIAEVESDQQNGYAISLNMNMEGTNDWEKLTGDNIGESICIVIDDKVYSAPLINDTIKGGRTIISGMSTSDEAIDLMNMINSGSIILPVKVIHYEIVSPASN